MTVLHPFAENEGLFNQMIRDFNLYNIWGIHVVGIAYPGYQALSHSLQSGELEVDMVIGMSKYLQAAGVPYEWIDLGNYANDPKYGVQDLYDQETIFASLFPRFDADVLPDLPLAYNTGLIYYNLGWAEALGEETVPLSLEVCARLPIKRWSLTHTMMITGTTAPEACGFRNPPSQLSVGMSILAAN